MNMHETMLSSTDIGHNNNRQLKQPVSTYQQQQQQQIQSHQHQQHNFQKFLSKHQHPITCHPNNGITENVAIDQQKFQQQQRTMMNTNGHSISNYNERSSDIFNESYYNSNLKHNLKPSCYDSLRPTIISPVSTSPPLSTQSQPIAPYLLLNEQQKQMYNKNVKTGYLYGATYNNEEAISEIATHQQQQQQQQQQINHLNAQRMYKTHQLSPPSSTSSSASTTPLTFHPVHPSTPLHQFQQLQQLPNSSSFNHFDSTKQWQTTSINEDGQKKVNRTEQEIHLNSLTKEDLIKKQQQQQQQQQQIQFHYLNSNNNIHNIMFKAPTLNFQNGDTSSNHNSNNDNSYNNNNNNQTNNNSNGINNKNHPYKFKNSLLLKDNSYMNGTYETNQHCKYNALTVNNKKNNDEHRKNFHDNNQQHDSVTSNGENANHHLNDDETNLKNNNNKKQANRQYINHRSDLGHQNSYSDLDDNENEIDDDANYSNDEGDDDDDDSNLDEDDYNNEHALNSDNNTNDACGVSAYENEKYYNDDNDEDYYKSSVSNTSSSNNSLNRVKQHLNGQHQQHANGSHSSSGAGGTGTGSGSYNLNDDIDDDDDDDESNFTLGNQLTNNSNSNSIQDGYDAFRKQNRKRQKGDLHCQVCGANANGYNFDAITCESCKAFFRRNAFRELTAFRCINNNNCVITIQTRKKCKKCRIIKCFNVGMRRDWIMTDHEREEKRRKIEENRRKKAIKQLHLQSGINEPLHLAALQNYDQNIVKYTTAVNVQHDILQDFLTNGNNNIHSNKLSSSKIFNTHDANHVNNSHNNNSAIVRRRRRRRRRGGMYAFNDRKINSMSNGIHSNAQISTQQIPLASLAILPNKEIASVEGNCQMSMDRDEHLMQIPRLQQQLQQQQSYYNINNNTNDNDSNETMKNFQNRSALFLQPSSLALKSLNSSMVTKESLTTNSIEAFVNQNGTNLNVDNSKNNNNNTEVDEVYSDDDYTSDENYDDDDDYDPESRYIGMISHLEKVYVLTDDDHQLIKSIVESYDIAVSTVTVDRTATKIPRDGDVNFLINITELAVRRLINYFKLNKDFQSLSQDIKTALLKDRMMELLLIHSGLAYDPETQSFHEPGVKSSTSFTTKMLKTSYGDAMYEKIMNTAKALNSLCDNNLTIIKLMIYVALFQYVASPSNMYSKERSELYKLSFKYTKLLNNYMHLNMKHLEPAEIDMRVARFIMLLHRIHTLGEEFRQIVVAKANPQLVNTLMKEVLITMQNKKQATDEEQAQEQQQQQNLNKKKEDAIEIQIDISSSNETLTS